MAQLDRELFVEYIYYIFLILIHFYSSFFLNKSVLCIKIRNYYLKHFFNEIRSLDEQILIVKSIHENLNNKKI